jgi:NAD(P)-dependent dehydrogenase (short-subunit alcohol dehydrogenase family)
METRNGNWTIAKATDQNDRVVIITGGNSGIGFEVGKALAALNAHAILAVRDIKKGDQAVDEILLNHPQASVEYRLLDLADLASIQEFAQRIQSDFSRLDLLVNNAGVMAIPRRETADGFEMQFGTNHLGHFALTGHLLPLLLVTKGSRVVTVSSALHERGEMRFDDLMGVEHYGKQSAYSQSKLANLLFAYELQRKLEGIKTETISVAAHPGYAATNLQYAGPDMEGSSGMRAVMKLANSVFAQSAEMGALPILYAALSEEVQGGDYVGPDGFLGMRGYPTVTQSSQTSHDLQAADHLWQVSIDLTGVDFAMLEPSQTMVPSMA